jgi:excisionase family DNA binding protein
VKKARNLQGPDPLLSPEEVSEWLGVPRGTLYQWRYRRRGPVGIMVGRHLRYRRSDIESWLEAQVAE